MANPLPNEELIYERIKKENIAVHPLLWELINHHINNDLYIINVIIGATVLEGEPLTKENAEKILRHTKEIKAFLDKLTEVTRRKQ